MAPRRSSLSCAFVSIALLFGPIIPALAAPETAPDLAPVQAPTATAPASSSPTPTDEVVIERVEASLDEVVLRDGSFMRGRIIELAKGSHVTITVDEESRQVPWAMIERVRSATAPMPIPTVTETPPSETPPSEAEPASRSSRDRDRRVYIDSTNGRRVTLYRISGEFVGSGSGGSVSGITYESVCSGVCAQRVDGLIGHELFVGGDGVTPSRRFTLGGPATLEVKAGSRAARVSGLLLLSMGGALLVTGLGMLPVSSSRPEIRRIATGFAIGGSAGVVIGIPLMVIGRTVVKQVQGRR